MDRSVLQKYTNRTLDAAQDTTPLDVNVVDDLGPFGWMRGIRERCLMLELRKKSGGILAVGYGWVEKIEFDPSGIIVLGVPGHRITIKGRNLNSDVRPLVRLFEGLTRHRIPWVREASGAELLEAPDGACVVESIEW